MKANIKEEIIDLSELLSPLDLAQHYASP
jgi:hypothetical protein